MSAGLGTAVWLTGPRQVEHRSAPLREPGATEIEICATHSALSHGTERLAYRGEISPSLALDLPSFEGSFGYPLKYGYASVGIVERTGQSVSNVQRGDAVFALHPHQDRFVIDESLVVPLPGDLPTEHGVFFAQTETALNVILDAQPRARESVIVFGQGVVGLLITALLARQDLEQLIAVDPVPHRRELALSLGATRAIPPTGDLSERVRALTDRRGADAVIEVSGAPAALDQAIQCVAVQGSVVVASWFGEKPVTLNLGSTFHRGRVRLISSQVGMVNPELAPRWDRARRSAAVRDLLPELDLGALISHRVPFTRAAEAYQLIDTPPENLLQVVLTY